MVYLQKLVCCFFICFSPILSSNEADCDFMAKICGVHGVLYTAVLDHPNENQASRQPWFTAMVQIACKQFNKRSLHYTSMEFSPLEFGLVKNYKTLGSLET